ncbi:Protein of unknown function [Gryllus bimaculatus]|nr:Protein of unknown function [Gryllus bimaculatus]
MIVLRGNCLGEKEFMEIEVPPIEHVIIEIHFLREGGDVTGSMFLHCEHETVILAILVPDSVMELHMSSVAVVLPSVVAVESSSPEMGKSLHTTRIVS